MFFRDEYALNARIAEYPKPIVAIADGITMGGGIGLAGHAAIRIVTERSKLAMPETRIGFTPDVGGTWLLAHAPGRLGEYLGLTGAVDGRLGRDLRRLRRPLRARPTHLDGAARRARDARRPVEPDRARAAVRRDARSRRALDAARAWIDDAFAADTVAEIVERLRARPEPEAAATADLLGELVADRRSP